MPEFEGSSSYTSFSQLGGSDVSYAAIANEIARLPIDGVLGFLASITIRGVRLGQDFFDPRCQGEYLTWAIADDFPTVLSRAGLMIAPGRTPYTGGRHTFIHEHNLLWLAHNAILHAQSGMLTDELDWKLRRRICRLLLIANDHIGVGVIDRDNIDDNDAVTGRKTYSLSIRRKVAVEWARNSIFNTYYTNWTSTLHHLARQRILLLEILPRNFNVEDIFQEAMNGVTLKEFFDSMTLFIAHYTLKMGEVDSGYWLSNSTLTSKLNGGIDALKRVFKRWICTPEQYRDDWHQCQLHQPATPTSSFYDYAPLRKKPLIEARPDELVCPVVSLLFAKMVDDPYYIICEHLQGTSLRDFQKHAANSYEVYAHSLIERIAAKDTAGIWNIWQGPPPDDSSREYADTLLTRGNIAIAFEHKGGRLPFDYIRGGDDNGDKARVIGPPASILDRLDAGEDVPITTGKREDKSIITAGMWQQTNAEQDLIRWITEVRGIAPSRVFPMITYLANIRIDTPIMQGYLRPLCEKANLYKSPTWAFPQWLNVDDLEFLAALAERGKLNLLSLLQDKEQMSIYERFDIFIFNRYHGFYADQNLQEIAIQMLDYAIQTFGGEGYPDILDTDGEIKA